MARLKLAIFDVDGTLIDSLAHIKQSMTMAFEQNELTAPSETAVRGIIGLSLFEAVRHLSPDISDATVDGIVSAYKESFARIRDETAADNPAPMFTGARACLDTLAATEGVVLAIATGKSRRGVDKMIAAHRLDGLFVSAQVADDHPSKPDPSMVLQCMADTGAELEDVVMIGDTTFDMEMGRNAGVKTIGVDWGYHETALLEPFSDHIVPDFDALRTTLGKMWEIADV